MFELAAPYWLAMIPIPALWLLWLRRRARRDRSAAAFTHTQADRLLQLASGAQRSHWRVVWPWLTGVTLLIVAMTQPRWLIVNAPENTTGHDIILAIDVSGSMRAEDFTLDGRNVNRLDIIKNTVAALLARPTRDRYGVVVFGDDVYTLAPLTPDHTLVTRLVNELSPGIAGEKTALGDALLGGITRLRASRGDKTLIVFTDGRGTAGTTTAGDALRIAKDEHVRIYTVAIGSAGQVIVPRGVRDTPALTDMPMDEPLLRTLASETNGEFVSIRNADGLVALQRTLSTLSDASYLSPAATPYRDWTWLPLLLGIVLVLAQRAWQPRAIAP